MSYMKGNKNLEFKQDFTNSFLKTVSAFLNFNGGKIIFGVNDNGEVVGLDSINEVCLKIESKINDCIKPSPRFTLEIDKSNKTIILVLEEGKDKPYFYNSKAYKRNDTATIEVSRLELNRLILEGTNQTYEKMKSQKKDLEFKTLAKLLKNKKNINEVTIDILKTLDLYDDGYNIAAELISDNNAYPYIDIVQFGDNINVIKNRYILKDMSILDMFIKTIEIFDEHYTYEEIIGYERKKIELIPNDAFREVLANAIVHRTWDENINIQISFYNNRVEVVSPGGLYGSITKEHYLNGTFSCLRNSIISNIFFRLNYIECFGTGIKRIKNSYDDYVNKATFDIFEECIKVTLPIVEQNAILSKDESAIFDVLTQQKMSSSEIIELVHFGKNKTIDLLKSLLKKGYIETIGSGRAKKYYKNKR